ncbi:MAG TPA: hypothetical protein VF736_07105 [Pyrinomonadaceae bacterium]
MRLMEALTGLVVGAGRFGDHLLKKKVSGVVVAALAFACGVGVADAPEREARTPCAAVAAARPTDPARAEVSMRDTVGAEAEDEDAVFGGEYENYAYGYCVEIPAGMVGLGSKPPAPQHGFGIDLDHPHSTAWIRGAEFPKSYVYVDGSYNSLGWGRLDDAVDSNLDFIRGRGRNVRLQRRAETLLGGLTALRVVARYEQDGVEMVGDEVVAFRTERDGGASVVYTLALSTPLSKYERDRPVLEALMKGWCLQPAE